MVILRIVTGRGWTRERTMMLSSAFEYDAEAGGASTSSEPEAATREESVTLDEKSY